MSSNSVPERRYERHMPLEGGCNFRDIGGYTGADGLKVRWGRVFRSGVLSYLTGADHLRLRTLRIASIFDLRRTGEREREPTRWCDDAARPFIWDDGNNAPSVMRFAADKEDSARGMREAMLDLYRALPDWMAPRIADLFRTLLESDAPVVVHCAAGKDRTGLAIAMVLLSLGVSRDEVMHDYLLTNELAQLEQFMASRKLVQLGVTDDRHELSRIAAEKRRVLFIADPDYLHAAFAQIERDYGSIDGYLERAVGLNAESRQTLRSLLLTSS